MTEHFILKGGFAHSALLGYLDDYRYDEEYEDDEEAGDAALAQFFADYELVGNEFPGNPEEDYYQGMSFTTVYKRKSDGKLFGYTYWQGGGKYGEPYYTSNGEELGYDDYDTYIFYEVTPFNVQGYYIKKD